MIIKGKFKGVLKRCDLEITSHSHDYPTKKAMVLARNIKASIVGIWRDLPKSRGPKGANI